MPDAADSTMNLVTKGYNGEYVKQGDAVQYQCKNGMKFSGNFSKEYTETTCTAGAYDAITLEEDKCVACMSPSSI